MWTGGSRGSGGRAEPGACLPILPTSRPMQRSLEARGCPPQCRTRPAPAPGFASRDSGLDGGLRGCLPGARFWGTRSRVQRKEAKSHLSGRPEANSVLPCFPSPPPAPRNCPVPLQFHELFLFLLLPTLQGDTPVELLCFVGGCREIVLCFVISLGVIVSPVFSCRLYGRGAWVGVGG